MSTPSPAVPFPDHTRLLSKPWLGEIPPAAEVFAQNAPWLLDCLSKVPDTPGVLMCGIYGGMVPAGQLLLTPDGALGATAIVGRHPSCDVRLVHDTSVALRHVLLRLPCARAGTDEMRVVDLHTGQGFMIEGVQASAAGARGDVAIQLGAYTLFLFRTGPDRAAIGGELSDYWASRPPSIIQKLGHANMLTMAAARVRTRGVSEVSVIPGLSSARRRMTGEPMPSATLGTVTFAEHNGESLYPLTGEGLDRGVLFGRYSRCQLKAGHSRWNQCVSRVHLVLLREGDEIFAIDTASRNGVRHHGEAKRIVRLSPYEELDVCAGAPLIWQRMGQGGLGIPIDWSLN